MADALERVAADESARALVLTADARRSFPAAFAADAMAAVLDQLVERQPPQLLAALRIPTIAALFGTVGTVGLELALACDLRIAADDAIFVIADLANGRLPCWGATQRLARVAGMGRALEMTLLGEDLSARDALACGLVTRLVPFSQLQNETKRVAGGLARGAPIALAYAKEAARQGADLPLDHALRLEWDLAVLLETTHDRAEGISAFLEKREPRFTGE